MTVLEAVQNSKTSYAMCKGSIKAAQKMLLPTEEIVWAMTANVYPKPVHGELCTNGFASGMLAGVIVVTDQRILFVNNVLGRGITKDIRISDIRSMDSKAGELFECLRIVGISDMIVTTCIKQEISSLRNAIHAAIAKNEPKPAAPSVDSSSDIEQLQAYKKLYDEGVLTAEEFAAKKAQILGL